MNFLLCVKKSLRELQRITWFFSFNKMKWELSFLNTTNQIRCLIVSLSILDSHLSEQTGKYQRIRIKDLNCPTLYFLLSNKFSHDEWRFLIKVPLFGLKPIDTLDIPSYCLSKSLNLLPMWGRDVVAFSFYPV